MSNNKKTALLIINCLQGGGAERSVLTLGQGFYDIGFDVHILRFKPLVEYDLNPNLNYHLLKFKPYKLIPGNILRHKLFAKKVDEYVIKNIGQPDIVLSNLERPDRVMTHSKLDNVLHVIRNDVANDFNIPADATLNHPKIQDLIQIYGNHPCVCVSKGVQQGLDSLIGEYVESTTIYNPFDVPLINKMANEPIVDSVYEQFSNDSGPEKAKSLREVLTSGDYIVHVGSFKPQKAHDVLLKSYAASQRKYPLVLIGQGKKLEETKLFAKQLGIDDKVYFLGFHKNPYPYVKNAKFFVLSSRFEGFVRVVAEAMALNTPVISTDCPSGPSELLDSEHLVPVDDIDALTDKMNQAMSNPDQFKAKLDDKFLPKNVARQYIDYLSQSEN